MKVYLEIFPRIVSIFLVFVSVITTPASIATSNNIDTANSSDILPKEIKKQDPEELSAVDFGYKVESFFPQYDTLSNELKELVYNKLYNWSSEAPINKTFYIENGRIEDKWGVLVIGIRNKEATEDAHDHTPQTQKDLIYIQNNNGEYLAAFEDDPNLFEVLDLIDESELSLEAKAIIWNYPVDDVIKENIANMTTNPKFPWQNGNAYRGSSRAPEWHNNGNALDFVPVNNTDNGRKIISPVNGVVTEICGVSQNTRQTYIYIKDPNNNEYRILHLLTSSIPPTVKKYSTIIQGDYLGKIDTNAHSQSTCSQHSDGMHLHFGLPRRDFMIDGYTFATHSNGSGSGPNELRFIDRQNQSYISGFNSHSFVSTNIRDTFSVSRNCQNGTSGDYCLDRPSNHVIKGRASTGTNSYERTYVRVEIRKTTEAPFTASGTVRIYDNNEGSYVNRLSTNSAMTIYQSTIPYSAGQSSIVFYIDPTYLDEGDSNRFSMRLVPSTGGTNYIDFHRLRRIDN